MELNITFLIQLALFLGVLFMLSGWLFPPILAVFEKREALIDKTSQAANALLQQAENLEIEANTLQAKTLEDLKAKRTQIKAHIHQEWQSQLKQAKEKAKEQLDLSKAQLEDEMGQVAPVLAQETAHLARLMSEKLSKPLGDYHA